MSKIDFPVLEGWSTVAQASDKFGISRQAVHKMFDSGVFAQGEVRKVGSGEKPIYLIDTEAIDRILEVRRGQ